MPGKLTGNIKSLPSFYNSKLRVLIVWIGSKSTVHTYNINIDKRVVLKQGKVLDTILSWLLVW